MSWVTRAAATRPRRPVRRGAGRRAQSIPAAVSWFSEVIARFGLDGRATLLHAGEAIVGPPRSRARGSRCRGDPRQHQRSPAARPTCSSAFRRRVMVDIDPGFTQFWHRQGLPGANVEGHDLYFTIGELIGTPDCPIPTGGIDWHPVRPPVVLDDWPRSDGRGSIGSRRSRPGARRSGRSSTAGAPTASRCTSSASSSSCQGGRRIAFEIALDIHPDDDSDLNALREHDWRIVDPRVAAGDPDAFRAYVQGSGAEFSVAQGVYVDTRSGWFSDRTTRYLASGRPALVQDTGLQRDPPGGRGSDRVPDARGGGRRGRRDRRSLRRAFARRRAESPRSTSTRTVCWRASASRSASPDRLDPRPRLTGRWPNRTEEEQSCRLVRERRTGLRRRRIRVAPGLDLRIDSERKHLAPADALPSADAGPCATASASASPGPPGKRHPWTCFR